MLARMILGELAAHDGSREQRELERSIFEQVGVAQTRRRSSTQQRLHHAIHWAIVLLIELDAVRREDAGPFVFYVLLREEPDAPGVGAYGGKPKFVDVSDRRLEDAWHKIEEEQRRQQERNDA